MLTTILIYGLLNTALITIVQKIGLLEKIQIYGFEFMNKLWTCGFCMGFWLTLFEQTYFITDLNEIGICIITALCSAVITGYLWK